MASDIVGRARGTLGIELRAGIGQIVSHLRTVVSSRDEADQVLRALASSEHAPDVADYDSARSLIALLALRDFVADNPRFSSPKIEVLTRLDARSETNYVQTLRAYLDDAGDAARAARRLGVHVNTLRYRMRRLVEVSGIDLEDPDERLLVSIELRLARPTP